MTHPFTNRNYIHFITPTAKVHELKQKDKSSVGNIPLVLYTNDMNTAVGQESCSLDIIAGTTS